MAEFKLGRIKFVWKGAWANGTTYYVDDIVRHGGITYICVAGHSSASDFYTDLNNVPSKWNQFSSGQDWKGDWLSATLYKIGDIVKYGGQIYICNTGHTSQATLEIDQSNWDLFSEGLDWKGDWTISTIYKENDIVKYGGQIYICKNAHTSANSDSLGLENNQLDWDLFSEGVEWKGEWTTSTRYKLNDVISYGGQIYICNTHHTSQASLSNGLETDQSKWSFFHKGTEYKGSWAPATRYKVNDLVKYGSSIWRCNTHHTSISTFDAVRFELFVEGLEFNNSWSLGVTYTPGDIVNYGGNAYVAKSINIDINPVTGTSTWDLFSQGFTFEGDYSNITFYRIGSVVRYGGYTYVAVADSTGATPPSASWSRLNSGFRWRGEWTNSTGYILGDVVSFNQFSYVCVLAHTSDDDDSTTNPGTEPNSPEKDSTGIFWNLLTSGLEESVLSSEGDLVYFSPAGVARLPVGEEGQVLTVVNGLPAWKTWGESENVLYVGLHGEDIPAPINGLTLDKPWRTVRYATEQIEKGYKNTDSAFLLTQNRTFIQAEIIGWTNAQIAGNIAPFTTSFTYDQDFCQRDMGLLVDAIVYDITHGGNVKTRQVAEAYFSPLGVSYITGQEAETVASINYGLSLIEKVLENEAPAISYQGINPNLQVINFNYTSEQGVSELIEDLIKVITDAITTGNLDNLPAENVPGYTINVKTGLFEEVLPIIVPSNTAIVGDELRSAKVSPRGKIIATNDKAKSLAAYAYLRSITDDIIQNTPVSPTSGNTVLQDTTSQKAGSLGSISAIGTVLALTAEIKDIVTNNTPNAYVRPNPTDWGTTLTNSAYAATGYLTGDTAGFDDGRRLLLANKAFLQDEVSEWILAQIAGNVAPFVGFTYGGTQRIKCERDVGLIVEAIAYDMTYGGNLATQIAARSYYSLGAFVEPDNEKAAALAVQLRIKDIIDNIIEGDTSGWTKTTSLTQDASGTAGSAGSGAFAQDRIQEVYDTIDTGTEPTTIQPYTAWVSAELLNAKSAIDARKVQLQSDAIQFIKRRFPTLNFNETLCSRDVGYIIDAIGFDLIFGSNYLTIQSGLSYRRGLASTNVVITLQLEAQQAVIDFIGLAVSEVASSGAVAFADLLWSYIIGIVTAEELPVNTGSNYPTTDLDIINGANILLLNADFMAAEATAWIADNYSDTVTLSETATDTFTITDTGWMVEGDAVRFSGTVFGGVSADVTYYISEVVNSTTFKISDTLSGSDKDLIDSSGSMTVAYYYDQAQCQNDVRQYLTAIANDMIFTGNYHVTLASRYYLRALRGSKLEDMYYVRNGCGIRNQTLLGLDGTSDGDQTGVQSALTDPNEFGTSRPRAGAYVSLDPGWGPNDTDVWVTNKSTYVQNVTTFGNGATGQKIDGALHAGGNDSIVSNDFTQVISDGVGAWITNLGRAELVSVFTYYAHIGYLAENGGKIRATNGNNSYGDFGAVSEGVDPSENPLIGKVNNRANQASIGNVISSNNEVLLVEYFNAGSNYNEASFSISGSGLNAAAVGDEIRDGGVFQVRLTDPGDSSGTGGDGYKTAANVAQGGSATTVQLAATDSEISSAYVGMGVWIVAGTGAGQYGYINSYNAGNKVAQVYKPSTGTPGWDHVVPGTAIASSLDLTSNYEIVPRLEFTIPSYSKALRSGLGSNDWKDLVYGDGFGEYPAEGHTGGNGSGATFDIVRRNSSYAVEIVTAGFSYDEGDVLSIAGANLGGTTPANNLTIIVDVVDVDTGGILAFSFSGTAINQQWVAVASGTSQFNRSVDGITWIPGTLPISQKWSSVAYGAVNGIGTYIACARESNTVAYSTDGINWTSVSLGAGEEWDWNSIAYGDGRFVMVSESDSSLTRRAVSVNGGVSWSLGNINTGAKAIAYGQGRFVIVEGDFSNSAAYSADGITWVSRTLPANDDSTESNWQDIAHGNNRFVAIADNDAQVAISIDRGVNWIKSRLPVNAPWKKVSYGNGLFFAFAEGDISATSEDGIIWTSRDFQATDLDILSTSKDRIIPWTSSTSIANRNWNVVYFADDLYVAIASNGSSVDSAYSSDGVAWTLGSFDNGAVQDVRTVAYGEGVWVAPYAGSNDLATSADGQTFTFQNNALVVAPDWQAVAYGNSIFLAIAQNSNASRYALAATVASTPATAWTAGGNLTSAAEWTDMAFGGGRFVAISGSTTNSDLVNWTTNGVSWTSATLPSSDRWSSIVYGNGKFVAVAGNAATTTTKAAYSTNGSSWSAATLPGSAARWISVVWNGTIFVATAYNSNRTAISEDGITWIEGPTMASTANWVSSTADDSTYQVVAVAVNSTTTNKLEYEANTNLLSCFDTSILAVGDYLVIPNDSAGVELFGGLPTDTRLYVKTIYDSTRFTLSLTPEGSTIVLSSGSGSMYATVNKIWSAIAYGRGAGNNGFIALATNNSAALNVYAGARTRGRPAVLNSKLFEIWIHEPGSNYDPENPPTMTITDPNNIGADATHQVRISNGVLGQPSFTNRGTGYTTADATLVGDGFADNYQTGAFVDFSDLTDIPRPGSNLQIAGIDDIYYKIVQVRNLSGAGTYKANIQLSPTLGSAEAPEHETEATVRSRFSQVRLTGHDFLEIGTGNQTETNYPGLPTQDPIPANETVQANGGRVFWTSTDQDGNFRVGGLFNVEQATGTATLNAEAFNLAGLNELSLGSVELGGGGAAITEFSTDPFFTADSDSVVPTQRAIKAYVSSQIGGGSGSLNVNTITAGSIFISGNTITTINSAQININTVVNFIGGVDGYPVALNLFLQA
jgi:hypothetical protein